MSWLRVGRFGLTWFRARVTSGLHLCASCSRTAFEGAKCVMPTDSPLPPIHIDLQEGFEDDDVVIRIGEEEVFRKEGVTTLPQIGRADGIEIPIGDGPVIVDVELPKRGVQASFSVPAPDMHLGISIEDGELMHEISKTPFRYA
jgi:hypothetical protein